MKQASLLLPLLLLLPLMGGATEELRNPFAESATVAGMEEERAGLNQEADKQPRYTPPLERESLNSYQLLGVVLSKKISLGVVQTQTGHQHLVRVGDRLGSAGGVIQAVSEAHLRVMEGDQ
ncbi:MAG: hypothetical protein HN344_08180, partial [Gammaproteobacteria bacterium]|nr:hypothetical protein [Gammaproteobacteria bacterium]